MTTRDHAPAGAPCWTDLWTSDVEGSRAFYTQLFGWEAEAPSPEFGGYFMFTRHGVPVAGGMGDMGDTADLRANNTWKIYLNTDDITRTLADAGSGGAEIMSPAMPVADLGTQSVLVDPTGAPLGAWQPGTFPGFTVLDEHGAPSWFELATRDYPTALAFYRTVFGLDSTVVGDSDDFRYATLSEPGGTVELAGIMDATEFLGEGTAAHWSTYWEVDDIDASVATVVDLGGSVMADPRDSPYGRMATVSDPAGAQFKLRTGPGAPPGQ